MFYSFFHIFQKIFIIFDKIKILLKQTFKGRDLFTNVNEAKKLRCKKTDINKDMFMGQLG